MNQAYMCVTMCLIYSDSTVRTNWILTGSKRRHLWRQNAFSKSINYITPLVFFSFRSRAQMCQKFFFFYSKETGDVFKQDTLV